MKKRGDLGEQYAADFIEQKGYSILERNWRGIKKMRSPEIDIIASYDDVLIFIEVKTTSTDKYGPPQEWITPDKQKRLTRAAEIYLSVNELTETACRFDVILVDIRPKPPGITHIKNAFPAAEFG